MFVYDIFMKKEWDYLVVSILGQLGDGLLGDGHLGDGHLGDVKSVG